MNYLASAKNKIHVFTSPEDAVAFAAKASPTTEQQAKRARAALQVGIGVSWRSVEIQPVAAVHNPASKLVMAVYKRFSTSDKALRGGKHKVMLTGSVAERFGVPSYTSVVLEDLSASDLARLAGAVRVVANPGLTKAGKRHLIQTMHRAGADTFRKKMAYVRRHMPHVTDPAAFVGYVMQGEKR